MTGEYIVEQLKRIRTELQWVLDEADREEEAIKVKHPDSRELRYLTRLNIIDAYVSSLLIREFDELIKDIERAGK